MRKSATLSCDYEHLGLMARIRQWHPTPVLCPENPMDGGAWWAAVHGVTKSQTRLSDFTFTFHFHALEKEMATHSSVLAWRIPGTGEPGGLPSMGSQSRTRLRWLSSSSSSRVERDTACLVCLIRVSTTVDSLPSEALGKPHYRPKFSLYPLKIPLCCDVRWISGVLNVQDCWVSH